MVSSVQGYGERHVEATYKYDSAVTGFTQQAGIKPLDSGISAEDVEKRPYHSKNMKKGYFWANFGTFSLDI